MSDPSRWSLEQLAAQVVLPVLDLRAESRGPDPWGEAGRRVEAGFGGLLLFGGDLEEVAAGLADLRARAGDAPPPLVASDLERGLAQQVRGGSVLPPLMAWGAAADADLVRAAAEQLGREARGVGIDWVLGPVLDLAREPRNPIVGTRALGADPERVAALGAAFVEGLQATGALACAKHFPGHGGTTADSHADLPVDEGPGDVLRRRDLAPFARAIEAGVATVMTAHVAYPGLAGGSRAPATLAPELVRGLLRDALGFAGVACTDALIMDGVLDAPATGDDPGAAEVAAAERALAAGCDALLYPNDPERVAAALARWAGEDAARAARLRQAAGRVLAAKDRVAQLPRPDARPERPGRGPELCARAVTRVGPERPPLGPGATTALLLLDDDGVAGFGHELTAGLVEAGVALRPAPVGPDAAAEALAAARDAAAAADRVVAAVGCRVRAWKGRPGLGPELAGLLRGLDPGRTTVVGLCGPAALRSALPAGAELLLAWGDEPAAQRAVAAVLTGAAGAPGHLPVPAEQLGR